jgi:glyoxylase-like metal-dependent hydrolase (beta-lactamase superfamily II)
MLQRSKRPAIRRITTRTLVAFGLAAFGLGAHAQEPRTTRCESAPIAALFKVFGAWLITSPEGHVLIDTLYGPYTDVLLDNIRALGFDPKDIKQVVITHGHFDHAGGAVRLKEQLPQARFAMTAEGWREAAENAAQSAGLTFSQPLVPRSTHERLIR